MGVVSFIQTKKHEAVILKLNSRTINPSIQFIYFILKVLGLF